MRKYLLSLIVLAALLTPATSCHTIIDDRIPNMAVRLTFTTQGDWERYGVAGALDHRRFIKSERIPVDYPYKALDYTGFGGLLLVGDLFGNPLAYDLACPVECKNDVRLFINTQDNVAECPVCHSTYDVFANYGHPLSGKAAEKGYGLRRYLVTGSSTEYMVITR